MRMLHIIVLLLFTFYFSFANAESKCLNPEFQAELIARAGCRAGQIESCEVISVASELKSYKYAGIAAFLSSAYFTSRIMKHTIDLDVDLVKRSMSLNVHNNQIKQMVDSIEELGKMEPNKPGFKIERVTDLRQNLKNSLVAIEKFYNRPESLEGSKFSKDLERMRLAENRLEIHARIAQAMKKSLAQSTPYGRIQIEGAYAEFIKNTPDLKVQIAKVSKGERSLAIKRASRWAGPLSFASGFGLAVATPLIKEKVLKDRAKSLGINLSEQASGSLNGVLYIGQDGSISLNAEPLAELFKDSEKWGKAVSSSPGLCEALKKFNDDSEKKFTPGELKELKCSNGSVSWLQKTARGSERIFFDVQSNGDLRFKTSNYYIDISKMQNGLHLSQPMGFNNIPLSIGDLRTNQLIGAYTGNLALCSNPKGEENINRCKVGEDLILNVQNFATIQSKCSSIQNDNVSTPFAPTDQPVK